jgi:glycosyltransferase involved in cell wall biosynthesis
MKRRTFLRHAGTLAAMPLVAPSWPASFSRAASAPLHVNGARLNAWLTSFDAIGRTPTGINRVAYSAADLAGRAFTQQLLRDAGFTPRVDTAGNIYARLEGLELLHRVVAPDDADELDAGEVVALRDHLGSDHDVDRFVALNRAFADQMAPVLGVEGAAIAVVPHGVVPKGYPDLPPDLAARRRSRGGSLRIGSLARACPEKGLDVLIRAVALLAATHDVRLVAAGAEIEVKLPEGVVIDQALMDAFKAEAAKGKLSSEQASTIATWWASEQQKQEKRQQTAMAIVTPT